MNEDWIVLLVVLLLLLVVVVVGVVVVVVVVVVIVVVVVAVVVVVVACSSGCGSGSSTNVCNSICIYLRSQSTPITISEHQVQAYTKLQQIKSKAGQKEVQ
jgi:hypothetical protein